jgi:putative heme iron utilization protein
MRVFLVNRKSRRLKKIPMPIRQKRRETLTVSKQEKAIASLFEFSDFNIVIIKPMSARVIAGFGQAITITGEDFSTTVGGRVNHKYPFSL